MVTPNRPESVTFRAIPPPGAGRFEVIREGQVIGSVGRFSVGAGQFGSTWMATTPDGRTSMRFSDRETAAAWLLRQLGS